MKHNKCGGVDFKSIMSRLVMTLSFVQPPFNTMGNTYPCCSIEHVQPPPSCSSLPSPLTHTLTCAVAADTSSFKPLLMAARANLSWTLYCSMVSRNPATGRGEAGVKEGNCHLLFCCLLFCSMMSLYC